MLKSGLSSLARRPPCRGGIRQIFTARSICRNVSRLPLRQDTDTDAACRDNGVRPVERLQRLPLDTRSEDVTLSDQGLLTAQKTAPRCPPDRPPTSTATHWPMPLPSLSVSCRPNAGPARLGFFEGGHGGLFGACIGVNVRSYIRVVKSREVVQNWWAHIGCTAIEVMGWYYLRTAPW